MNAKEIVELAERIKPILAGREPALQSAVLAELTSLWLAGHFVPGDREQTADIRARLLAAYCQLVLDLTKVNAKEIGTD